MIRSRRGDAAILKHLLCARGDAARAAGPGVTEDGRAVGLRGAPGGAAIGRAGLLARICINSCCFCIRNWARRTVGAFFPPITVFDVIKCQICIVARGRQALRAAPRGDWGRSYRAKPAKIISCDQERRHILRFVSIHFYSSALPARVIIHIWHLMARAGSITPPSRPRCARSPVQGSSLRRGAPRGG